MRVEAAERFIPRGDDMRETFTVVSPKHILRNEPLHEMIKKPWNRLGLALGDYFAAGVAYLANRGHDEYIRKIGTTTWWAINQQRVIPSLVSNMPIAAMQLGVPPEIANSHYTKIDEPHMLFTGAPQEHRAYILVPPHFLVQTQQQPVEALATIASISSQVQDLSNERLNIDPHNFNARAQASKAHLLLEARRRYPGIEISRDSEHLLTQYPQGIMSLPPEMRY